jgi:tetratricopeptide (TPR) repeat protein
MASKLTSYRVFIASPGGLEDERQAFRDVLSVYNESEAIPRRAYYVPVGWEITLRGVGRAQEKINAEVRECDFFVLLLWDRWGTPTGSSKHYTSGTEEEYAVALECYQDPQRSMREVIVFFKAVTPRQLSDPGEQLRKVLDFKRKLEDDKLTFFDTFDETSSFAEKLRKYLGLWTRLHDSGQHAKVKRPSLSPGDTRDPIPKDFAALNPSSQPVTGKNPVISEAKRLAKRGKITEAEALFTQAISRYDDPAAFSSYGEFLLNQHRWTQAESIFRELIKVADALGDENWAIHAHDKLGAVYLVLKNFNAARDSLRNALTISERVGDRKKTAIIAQRLGYLYIKIGNPDLARPYSEQAKDLFIREEEWRGAGDATADLAKIAIKLDMKSDFIHFLEEASGYYKQAGQKGLAKSTEAWRSAVLRKEEGLPPLPIKKTKKKKKQKKKKKKKKQKPNNK